MKEIWKFSLDLADSPTLEVPKGTEIISVGVQPVGGADRLCVWGIVPIEEKDKVKVKFIILGTGHSFMDTSIAGYRFLGTVQTGQATLTKPFVWHVFIENGHWYKK